jgi:hypothetical protein
VSGNDHGTTGETCPCGHLRANHGRYGDHRAVADCNGPPCDPAAHGTATRPGWGGRWDLADGTPDRLVWDLSCLGGATLQRACRAMREPASGTKIAMARRLHALGLHAEEVKARWGVSR